jgi:hypothetical protein
MERMIALLAGVFMLQGCLQAGTVLRGIDRQTEARQKLAVKKMQDGLRKFNEGYRMVITGVEMNNIVAVQQGLQEKIAPGNKVIQDGLNKMDEGGKLYYRGEMVSGPEAPVGINLMREGFKIAYGDGMRLVKQGVEMSNLVANQEGATDKFSQNNQVIQNGMLIMEDGAKLFMQGENLYLNPGVFNIVY